MCRHAVHALGHHAPTCRFIKCVLAEFKLNVAKDQEKNKQTKNKKEQPNLSRHLMRTLEGWRWRGKGTEERKGTYRN